jgi:imidazole glycerol-phosphate synthase subunit HisH
MSKNNKITIIDYGAGNVQSVLFALERLGYTGKVTNDVEEIRSADKVIFPGVGEASSAMRKLEKSGLDVVIPKLQQPVLGICLGMQLLCKSSEENNTKALGIFDIEIKKFTKAVKVPQMGWNTIDNLQSNLFNDINENSYVYLVHSYFAPKNKYMIASSFYQEEYATAIQKNNFYGTQFHPEKSGSIGEKILDNFLKL